MIVIAFVYVNAFWLLYFGTETITFFRFFLVPKVLLCCREAKNLSRAQLYLVSSLYDTVVFRLALALLSPMPLTQRSSSR